MQLGDGEGEDGKRQRKGRRRKGEETESPNLSMKRSYLKKIFNFCIV
jgi:hypothetical protein